MKTSILITLITLFLCDLTFAQNKEKYFELVKEASTLCQVGDFQKSGEKYKAAFSQLKGKAYEKDRYNAASAYALAEDMDNAFYHLFYLAESRMKYSRNEGTWNAKR